MIFPNKFQPRHLQRR